MHANNIFLLVVEFVKHKKCSVVNANGNEK